MKHVEVKKYDALVGRSIRDIKTTDIQSIVTTSTNVLTGNGIIAQGVVNSNSNLFLTGMILCASSPGSSFYVTCDTSTIAAGFASGTTANNPGFKIITTKDAPFFVADANSTITVVSTSTSGWSVWLYGIREPSFAKVETI